MELIRNCNFGVRNVLAYNRIDGRESTKNLTECEEKIVWSVCCVSDFYYL
jgi:hypothetical protein